MILDKGSYFQFRLFGTYAAERKDEELAYGLVDPINSFDQLYTQV